MKRAWVSLVAFVSAGGVGGAGGCSSQPAAPTFKTRAEMLQPETCAPCHKSHFDDWSQSMHAQAADDPVFIAMNKRGQRETNGTLGKFCVQCHAPMAVRDGLTTDGLNLASLPTYYKGVTCFFCHSIDSVGAQHDNASVNLATDLVMRGELAAPGSGEPPPVANSAHASAYSTFHDDAQKDGAVMCGSCHDIDSPAGAHIERTFAEWSASAFSGPGGNTCTGAGCHMTPPPKMVPVATGGPDRLYHPHNFPAVDVSLETSAATAASPDGGASPEGGEESSVDGGESSDSGGLPAAVQFALNDDALIGALCVGTTNSTIRVILDTAGIGHHWPSGAAQDRRAWAEVIAYNPDGSVMYSSGVVPDGTPVTSIKDPDLWLLRDCMFNAQSQQVDNFWQAAKYSGAELPALLTFDASSPEYYANHIVQSFPRPSDPSNGLLTGRPVKVTLRVRIQPVGLDVLSDLASTGDLDPSVAAKMPTFDVSLQGPIVPGINTPGGLVWTPTSDDAGYTDSEYGMTTCATSPGFKPVTTTPAQSAATCTPPTQ
jgi:hypothetical protein